jgi:16S rRNA (guanine527-N7)-methyltransferase
MHPTRIAELLEPFLPASSASDQRPTANDALYQHISTYIDILLRWNARINLTAIRGPEKIVTRHFGESLFASRHLFPTTNPVGTAALGCPAERSSAGASAPEDLANHQRRPLACPERSEGTSDSVSVADVGSGAGFPGIPIKLWAPHLALTLIESNHKKATFLREIVRALTLTNVNVFSGRAEQLLQVQIDEEQPVQSQTNQPADPGRGFDLVTLRAVEHFADVLPVAARLVSPSGRLALLISTAQLNQAHASLPSYSWDPPLSIPQSNSRALLIGHLAGPSTGH